MKILILKGQSRYDVLRIFSDTMASAFKKLGNDVEIFDGTVEDVTAQLQHTKLQYYDLVFSFNGIMVDSCDIILNNPDTLFWSFLVDHPYYHHIRLRVPHKNHIVSCIDHTHVQYLKQYYPNIKASYFMPHGGNVPSTPLKDYNDRKYNVVFLGSYSDTQPLETSISQLPDLVKMIVNEVIKNYYSIWTEPLENLYQYEFKKYQLDLSKEELSAFLNEISYVDEYIRAINRELILNTLTANGIVVDVFGANWEHYECPNPENLRIHGHLGYTEALEVMCNSKLVLNPLPLFTNGSHERVFTSMLCGAVCVSEQNMYLSKEFTDGENIAFFQMQNLLQLPKIIQALLDHPSEAASIAEKGHALAAEHHTWEKRAEDLLEIASQYLNTPA